MWRSQVPSCKQRAKQVDLLICPAVNFVWPLLNPTQVDNGIVVADSPELAKVLGDRNDVLATRNKQIYHGRQEFDVQ